MPAAWPPAAALAAACAVAVAALLVAERRGHGPARVLAKLTASSCFVAFALSLGAAGTAYGRWILAALALGWAGDALLLSAASAGFLAGLGAFLLAHLCFAVAFAGGAFSIEAAALAALPALATGVLIGRWLRPHLGGGFGRPVAAYIVVILAMCTAAAGRAAGTGQWVALAGALMFAASDIAVARDRFVAPGFVNRAWGLPLYYAAQLVLGGTVAR